MITHVWDFKRIAYNRNTYRKKPIDAFKDGKARRFESVSQAVLYLEATREAIKSAILKGKKINGYTLKWNNDKDG